jgi:hypothetical protein
MLRNKLNRYTTAFLTMMLASILLYPSAQIGFTQVTWLLLGLTVLSAFLTLMTK